jgi:hypothetical protein
VDTGEFQFALVTEELGSVFDSLGRLACGIDHARYGLDDQPS